MNRIKCIAVVGIEEMLREMTLLDMHTETTRHAVR